MCCSANRQSVGRSARVSRTLNPTRFNNSPCRFDEIIEWFAIFRFAWNKPRRSHTPPSLSPTHAHYPCPESMSIIRIMPANGRFSCANRYGIIRSRQMCSGGYALGDIRHSYTCLITRTRCVDRRTRFIYGTGDGLEQRRRRRGLAILVRMNTVVVVIRVTYGNARADGQLRGYTCVVDDLEIRVCSVNC